MRAGAHGARFSRIHRPQPPLPGLEALEILRRQDPVDVVITDYAMPHITGLQLADAIKKEWPELPVIIATGFAEMQSEVQPVLPRLAKPFTEAELVKELEHIVPRGGEAVEAC